MKRRGKIEEEIAILIHRAEQMGFRFVDMFENEGVCRCTSDD